MQAMKRIRLKIKKSFKQQFDIVALNLVNVFVLYILSFSLSLSLSTSYFCSNLDGFYVQPKFKTILYSISTASIVCNRSDQNLLLSQLFQLYHCLKIFFLFLLKIQKLPNKKPFNLSLIKLVNLFILKSNR